MILGRTGTERDESSIAWRMRDNLTRADLAAERGYEPERYEQPAMTPEEYEALPPDDPQKKRIVRWVHQAAVDCESCGVRCDRCEDRMCSKWGPEPRACGVTCDDCPCDCTTCLQARADLRADLSRLMEREEQ